MNEVNGGVMMFTCLGTQLLKMSYVENRGKGWMRKAIGELLSETGEHCQEMVVEECLN